MSKRNRERKARTRARMRDLGLTDANLSRTEKRQLRRHLSGVKTLLEIRAGLQQLSSASIIRQVACLDGLPPHIVSRVVHEAALINGDTEATAPQVRALANDLHNVADPAALARVGIDFSDHVTQRFLASQLIGQMPPLSDIHRILAVLAPDIEDGVLGRGGWRALLGMDLTDLIVGVIGMNGLVGPNGEMDAARLAQLPSSIGNILNRSVGLLSADVEGIRQVAAAEEERFGVDVIRGPGPLVQFPLVRLAEDRFVVPSRAHLDAAVSTAAFYIRLARADHAEKTRERSKAVGHAFDEYLQRIAADALTDGWIVVNLDEDAEGHVSKADFLLVPPAGDFVLVVESKTKLQVLDGQLRPWANQSLVEFYQDAFDQIDASASPIASDGLPVYGLVVTLDRHITSRIGGRTVVGVPITEPASTTPSASSATPARVISAQDFEDLIESLAGGVEDPAGYISAICGDGSTMNATERIRAGRSGRGGSASLSERLHIAALERLASSARDGAVRAVLTAALR